MLSTLTETQTSDLTIVTTTLIPVQPSLTQLQPSLFVMTTPSSQVIVAPAVTTELTLSITDNDGDVTELVTQITIPGTVLNTRARRDIRPTSLVAGVSSEDQKSQSVLLNDRNFISQEDLLLDRHRLHLSSSHSTQDSNSLKPNRGHLLLSASFSSPSTNTLNSHSHGQTPFFQSSSNNVT